MRKGVEKYSNLDEYVKAMMKKFDINGDGTISIDELDKGLKSINVSISPKEKLALMKDLDRDRDGGINETELYNALAGTIKSISRDQSSYNFSKANLTPNVEIILKKIRQSVSHYKSKQE